MAETDADAPLARAVHHARDWLAALDRDPAGATADFASLRAAFDGPLPETGVDAASVIDDLARNARPGLHGNTGGRFFGWVMGGSTPAALAADWLVSAWDQNGALYSVSPATAVIEEVAGRWMLDLFELPSTCSFAFTTGCQLAHVTALAAARHAVLARAGWRVEEDGLFGAPKIRVVTSENRHNTLDRALRFLGIGRNAMYDVPTDELGRMDAEAFEKAMRDADGPVIAVLNAADLNVAAFDDFSKLIPIARAAGAWVHIDGAFGLFARASRTKRAFGAGLELADSWAVDGHKWLNVPFDCGFTAIRDREAHYASMTQSAGYLSPDEAARDQHDWNLELSRRARAVPVFAVLRELGRDGVADIVERCCAHAHAFVTRIGALRGAEIVAEPTLNQGLVRFHRGDGADDAAFTDEVIQAINASGEAFFSPTTWRGRRVMRVSVVSWRTTDADVDRAIAAAKAVLDKRV